MIPLTIGTDGRNTHADDTTENRVSGRHRHADPRSEGQVDGRGNDGADHSEHEKFRDLSEERGIDDLGTNGVGNASTNTDGAGKLHDGGENHGLEVGHGLGSNGRRP